jgi:hypothetical protein
VEAIDMLDLSPPVGATEDAITDVEPSVSNDNLARPAFSVTEPPPPVLITEEEVMLGSAVVVRPRSTPITRRMIDTVRAVTAWRPPPPRPHYAPRAAYIERAAMSREMDRL